MSFSYIVVAVFGSPTISFSSRQFDRTVNLLEGQITMEKANYCSQHSLDGRGDTVLAPVSLDETLLATCLLPFENTAGWYDNISWLHELIPACWRGSALLVVSRRNRLRESIAIQVVCMGN